MVGDVILQICRFSGWRWQLQGVGVELVWGIREERCLVEGINQLLVGLSRCQV